MARTGRPRTVDHYADKVASINERLDRFFAQQRRRILAIGAPRHEDVDEEERLRTYWRQQRLGEELRYHADKEHIEIEVRK